MKSKQNNLFGDAVVPPGKLVKTEPQLRQSLDSLLEGIQIIDFNWRYVYVNHAMSGFGKRSKKEFLGFTMMEKYPAIEGTEFFKVLQQCMAQRKPKHFESEFESADKSKRWFEHSIEAVKDGIFILSIDITLQKRAEEKLNKANHLYAFISQVNQKIVRVKDEETLFHNACHMALEFGKFKMAWIGLFDYENKTISLADQSGISEEDAGLFSNSPYANKGSQNHVLRTGTNYICNDVQNAPELESWKPFAVRHGIRSCMVLPIKRGGNIIGTFNLYSTEINFAEKEEIALLIEVTGDISYALDMFEKAKKHKEADELLVKSERQFRSTLDHMLEGIQIHDFNWRYIYVNDALVKYSAYTKEELLGHTLMEKYPDIEQTLLFETMQRCMNGRVAEHLETEFTFPDGTTRDFELSIQPTPEGILVLSVDRSEEKKARELLIKNEKRFRALIEKSADMQTLSDLEGRLIYGSPSITKVLGYSLEEFLSKSADEFIHPDDIHYFLENTNELLRSQGASMNLQQRLLHKDGYWIWCDGTITNMLHEPGVHALVSNFRDVSEKKLAQLQQEFDSSNLNALINNTKDLMWSVDRDFNLITANKEFDVMVRYMSGSVIQNGESVFVAGFSPQQLEHFRESYERAFAGEAFSEIEHTSVPTDIWSEISYQPIYLEGQVIGTACQSHDITAIKQAEEQLVRSEAGLRESQSIAHIGNWSVNLETDVHTWSDEVYNIYRIKKGHDQPSTELFLSFVHKDDVQRAQKNLQKSLDTLKDSAYNFRFIRRDGVLRHGYTEVRFEFDENKKPIRQFGILQDVTVLRESERQLRTSESFNRGVLNSLSSHIAVIDAIGNIVAVNDAWKKFAKENGDTHLRHTGVDSNYFEACAKAVIAGDEMAHEVLQGMNSVMQGKKEFYYLEYPCHSPEEQRWFALRVLKFDNHEQMVVAAHMDITELRKAQEERDITLLELEDRVEIRTSELREKNTNILDSINYAKRIQLGLLSRPSEVAEIFPSSFILSLPRDIVSGDFFWCYQRQNKKFIVVADCTGHGVPGALMSIIGNNLLNTIIVDERIETPSEILELLDIRLTKAVMGDTHEIMDGMDIALCVVDTYFNELYYGGAFCPLYLTNEEGKITELPADRLSIGGGMEQVDKKFETRRIPIIPGQRIYMSSDGIYSQFGGPNDKKFMRSRFVRTLESLQNQPLHQHKKMLLDILDEWTGNNEQVDDVMVVGIEL